MKPDFFRHNRASAEGRRPHQAAQGLSFWAYGGALVGVLLATVLFAPAHWLAEWVYSGTGQHLLLVEPRGTVWRGSAQLILTGGPGSRDVAALPDRVQWSLRPGFGGLNVSLLSECCTPDAWQLLVTPRLGGALLELADAQAFWPAELLTGLGTPWNTLEPSGQLSLRSRGLSAEWKAGKLMVAGSAILEARDVSSRLSTLHPMGSYRLHIQGGAPVSLRLETLEGSLRLDGRGEWVGSRLRFSGEASTQPEREAALANFLNIVGKRNGLRSAITLGSSL